MWLVFVNGPNDCLPAYTSAKYNDLKVLTIWFGRQFHSLGDKHLICSNQNPSDIIKSIRNLLEIDEILGCIAFIDAMVPIAGLLNSSLNLTCPYSFDQAIESKNKLAMRKLLDGEGLNPEYHVLKYDHGNNNYLSQICNISFSRSWIVKPIFGHASIGVVKVNSLQELEKVLPAIHSANQTMLDEIYGLNIELKNSFKNTYLLESYFEGSEFSVEVLILNNQVYPLEVCSKTEMKSPYFEEITYRTPAKCELSLRSCLSEATKKIVQKMKINNTCAHLEFKWNGHDICFLDIGLRAGGGGLTHKLIEISSGRDLFGAWFRSIKQSTFNNQLNMVKSSIALLYLSQIRNGGKVLAFNIDKLPSELSSFIKEYKLFVKSGDILTGYPDYSGLPGYVIYEIPAEIHQSNEGIIEDIILQSSKYFDPIYEVN